MHGLGHDTARRHVMTEGALCASFQSKPLVTHMAAPLHAEHEMLKAALHAVTAQLRKARGRAATRAARPRAATECTAPQWRTLCSLCAAKHGDTSIAAAYLRHVHGSRLPGSACETLLKKVHAWWLRSSAEDRSAWAGAPRTRAESLAVAAARSFVHASTLHSCIAKENFVKGIAPTSQALLHLLRNHGPLESCGTTHVPRRKSQFQWLRRWRTRWHVKLGRIPAREHTPDDVARSKAARGERILAVFTDFSSHSPHLKAAPQVNARQQKGVHQAALILGPRCVPCRRGARRGPQLSAPFFSWVSAIFHI